MCRLFCLFACLMIACSEKDRPKPSADPLEEAKVETAHAQAKVLVAAAMTYHLNNHSYSKDLNDLTINQPNGGPPIIEAERIIDPWGNKFRFEVVGGKPRVWTATPSGKTIIAQGE